uniref:D-isomer specific 2-hydroxyacid dehydrogenase NAD-binding domain-containing protein n=1 Tax=Bionectria ochroleuca TaxID=29856 RepID=A0A8H7N3W1_BIOOC
MSKKHTVLVIGNPDGLVELDRWEKFATQYEVLRYGFKSQDEFHESLSSGPCSVISGIGWTRLAMKYFPSTLRVIVNFGHGFEEEDIEGLNNRRIKFYNSCGGSESTATIGTYLTIAAFRNLSRYERMLRSGQFLPALRESLNSALDVQNKHVGIIGMGAIGQALAKQVAALGMHIHAVDRPSLRSMIEDTTKWPGQPKIQVHDTIDLLVPQVDCIILTCPYSTETHQLLSRERFRNMKKGVRIVNIARGKCIDEEALCEAIDQGIVGGVGLDVYENEPQISAKLLEKQDFVTLLPHVGGLTVNAMAKHAQICLNKMDKYLSQDE